MVTWRLLAGLGSGRVGFGLLLTESLQQKTQPNTAPQGTHGDWTTIAPLKMVPAKKCTCSSTAVVHETSFSTGRCTTSLCTKGGDEILNTEHKLDGQANASTGVKWNLVKIIAIIIKLHLTQWSLIIWNYKELASSLDTTVMIPTQKFTDKHTFVLDCSCCHCKLNLRAELHPSSTLNRSSSSENFSFLLRTWATNRQTQL